jgi:adiponectin receptor
MWYDARLHIHEGYRAGMSYFEMVASLLQIHNETLNIWSHLLPLFYTSYYILMLWFDQIPELKDNKYLMTIACLAELICFFLSSMYHLFKDKGAKECHFLLKMDLLGILVMIFGLSLTCVYIGFSLHPDVRVKVMLLLIIWGLLNAVLGITPCYAEDRCEKFRILVNIATICLCFSMAMGWYFYLSTPEEISLFFGPLMMSYVWLGIGAGFYFSHFPECLFTEERVGPKVSRWVQLFTPSHLWWHVFTAMNAYTLF